MCACAAKAFRACVRGCAAMSKRAESASASADAVRRENPTAQETELRALFSSLPREQCALGYVRTIVDLPVFVGFAPRSLERRCQGYDACATKKPQLHFDDGARRPREPTREGATRASHGQP